jgi:hypothetical protein
MTKVSTAPADKSLEAPSPEVQAEKRVWATPTFEEFDYTITQATIAGVGADGLIYS